MNVKDVILKYVKVDLKGLLVDYVMEVVVKAKLEAIVKDTSNPYDDMLLAYVYPMLKDAAEKAVVDLEEKIGV